MRAKMLRISVLLGLPLLAAVGCTPGERKPPAGTTPEAEKSERKVQVVEEFWPDGKLRLRQEVLKAPDGALINDGRYTSWFDNGNKEYEATYVDGKLEGVATAWHRNGKRWTEEHYQHGVRHGTRLNWDEKGRLRGEEHYYEGKSDGTWTIWKPDGTVEWQGHFNRGQPE